MKAKVECSVCRKQVGGDPKKYPNHLAYCNECFSGWVLPLLVLGIVREKLEALEFYSDRPLKKPFRGNLILKPKDAEGFFYACRLMDRLYEDREGLVEELGTALGPKL